ncbi:pyridoxamine 5'-phosphate oxidase family protein [Irregularibacter muris]|uniref:Pyridoxamine 5'-phosphate oxidase family protein n=1 Tax=Irregularibacter muris TaxID=1796619 RepID=A0AAE3HI07_9FIRM|nr:pyridoxamine 5'-phosphate oxidase family protein [Irregularibacter muris]MCR1899917.1 pyridoxamine 5'-phosphate oxidase family protein [Irregularibacter muris]
MFKDMRRKDRKLGNAETLEILKNGEYGILSTISENGYPYAVPLSYIYMNDSIYFDCSLEGQKLDNIKHDDKVSFCVIGKTHVLPDKFTTNYESAMIVGRASEVLDEEKNKVLLELLHKYSPNDIEKGKEYIKKSDRATKIIKINIEHISGKARK